MKLLLALLLGLASTGIGQFSQERALATLRHLAVEIGPRPMGSPAEQEALRFAAEAFREAGCDTSYVMPMRYTPNANTTSGIAVGIKRGPSGRSILVGGHIDSQGPEVPGADDDGSGAADVIELARVFAQRENRSTLIFCCFGGEEQGLRGSEYFARNFPGIDSVALMIQLDMANGLGRIDLDPNTFGAMAPRWLTRAAVEEYSKLGYDHLRYPTHFFSMNYSSPVGSGSDHQSFLDIGIPAIDFSTDVGKPIHTPRDNFENFEPAGLERSGVLAQRLIERFDGNIPARSTERYWLLLVGGFPLMVPVWCIPVFLGATLILAAVALLAARRQMGERSKARWESLKVWLFALLIVSFGWFSSDLIGLLRGIRHPWYTSLDLFIVQAGLGALIGIWCTLRLARKLPEVQSAYYHFKRAAIILALFTALLGWAELKLAIEPASALFLLSLALLLRRPWLRTVLLLLSPVWFFRLPFNEWRELTFRLFANVNTSEVWRWALYNGAFILLFSLLLVPFLFGAVAVFRDMPVWQALIARLRGVPVLAGAAAAFIVLSSYLLTVPVYTSLWYRAVKLDQRYDMNSGNFTIELRGNEYLAGMRIRHAGGDTLLAARSIIASIAPGDSYDTSWVSVSRAVTDSLGETRVRLRLAMASRPFTVSVAYALGGKSLPRLESPWKSRSERSQTVLRWYSFPDSNLVIPLEFTVPPGDSVQETITVEFAKLAYPMTAEQDLAYVLPRTTYTGTYWYKR